MTSVRPVIECEQQHASVFVAELHAAIVFYTQTLGFTLAFQWGEPPKFAGVNLDRRQIFLDANYPPNPSGCCLFFNVADVDELHDCHRANGVEIAEAIGDGPWRIRDYTVRDLHGYHIVFGQHLLNAGPPIRIERVDVPVRMEKRLAALMEGLASRHRKSVSSLLEDILLHTTEGVGPYTQSTLRYIQELNKKHGIDYDSHGAIASPRSDADPRTEPLLISSRHYQRPSTPGRPVLSARSQRERR
jgi:catechol 2,3-dioxygenase-like lactoylglutathione lyase family enzyme